MVKVFLTGEERLARPVEKALFGAGFSVNRVLPEVIWWRLEREFPSAPVLVASTAASVMPLLDEAPTSSVQAPIIASETELDGQLRHALILAGALDCVQALPPGRLIAKVGVLVRNLAGLVDDFREGPIVEVGDLRIEPGATEVYLGNTPLGVNRIEFRLVVGSRANQDEPCFRRIYWRPCGDDSRGVMVSIKPSKT